MDLERRVISNKRVYNDVLLSWLAGWLTEGINAIIFSLLTPSACKASIAYPEVRPILDQVCVKEKAREG